MEARTSINTHCRLPPWILVALHHRRRARKGSYRCAATFSPRSGRHSTSCHCSKVVCCCACELGDLEGSDLTAKEVGFAVLAGLGLKLEEGFNGGGGVVGFEEKEDRGWVGGVEMHGGLFEDVEES